MADIEESVCGVTHRLDIVDQGAHVFAQSIKKNRVISPVEEKKFSNIFDQIEDEFQTQEEEVKESEDKEMENETLLDDNEILMEVEEVVVKKTHPKFEIFLPIDDTLSLSDKSEQKSCTSQSNIFKRPTPPSIVPVKSVCDDVKYKESFKEHREKEKTFSDFRQAPRFEPTPSRFATQDKEDSDEDLYERNCLINSIHEMENIIKPSDFLYTNKFSGKNLLTSPLSELRERHSYLKSCSHKDKYAIVASTVVNCSSNILELFCDGKRQVHGVTLPNLTGIGSFLGKQMDMFKHDLTEIIKDLLSGTKYEKLIITIFLIIGGISLFAAYSKKTKHIKDMVKSKENIKIKTSEYESVIDSI